MPHSTIDIHPANCTSTPATAIPRMPRWLLIAVAVACALLCAIQVLLYGGVGVFEDGPSYYKAWDNLKLLHPNQWRPPVYPIIVGSLSELLGREASLIAVSILQWLLYALSLRLLWDINSAAGLRRGWNIAAIIAVLLIPGFWVMNNIAIAESLSSFGIVALIWLTIRYRQTHSRRTLLLCGLLLILLLFTKPVFIFLIPLIAIFWWEADRHGRSSIALRGAQGKGSKSLLHSHLRIVILIPVTAGVLLAGYAYNWKRYNGEAGLTRATFDNLYYIARQNGTIIPEEIPDSALRERFRPFFEASNGERGPGYNIYGREPESFTVSEKKLMAETARRNHPAATLRGTAMQFAESATYSIFYYFEPHQLPDVTILGISPDYCNSIFYPFNRQMIIFPLWLGWLGVICSSILWIRRWRRTGVFPAEAMLAASIFFCGMMVSVVGAQDSWGRLIAPFMLLFPLMFFYPLQCLCRAMRRRNGAKS